MFRGLRSSGGLRRISFILWFAGWSWLTAAVYRLLELIFGRCVGCCAGGSVFSGLCFAVFGLFVFGPGFQGLPFCGYWVPGVRAGAVYYHSICLVRLGCRAGCRMADLFCCRSYRCVLRRGRILKHPQALRGLCGPGARLLSLPIPGMCVFLPAFSLFWSF